MIYKGELTSTAVAGEDTDEVETAALGVAKEATAGAGFVAVGRGSGRGEGGTGEEERDDSVELHGCGVERLDWES